MDAGPDGPPIIRLLAPGRDVEVYQGDRVSFSATCTAVGSAQIVERAWQLASTGSTRAHVAGDSTAQTFTQLGHFELDYACRDDRGLSSSVRVLVHVQSLPPYLVYGDPDHVRAARVDRLDRPESIEPPFLPVAPLVDQFQYALGGKVVIARASLERHRYTTYAIYRDAAPGSQLHELDTMADSELRTRSAYVSPDGRYVLVPHVGFAPLVYRLDASGPVLLTAIALSPTVDQATGVEFSSDSRYLLYWLGGPLELADLETGAHRTLVPDTATAGIGLVDAKLTGDGTHVAYSQYQVDGHTTTRLISVTAALAGDSAVALGGASSSGVLWAGKAGYVLTQEETSSGSAYEVVAYDRDGTRVASWDNGEPRAFCDDTLFVARSNGSLEVVHTSPGGTTESLVGVDPPTNRALLSGDCQAVAYESGNDVVFFALPAAGSPPSTPAVQRVVGQKLATIGATSAGPIVLSYVPGTPAPLSVQLNRIGVAPVPFPSAAFALTRDGTGALVLRSPHPGGVPEDRYLDLLAFTGPDAGTSRPIYGPFRYQSPTPALTSPDGHSLLLSPIQSVSVAGELVGLRGLVEVDLDNPTGPGTRALLPDGDPDRGEYDLRRVPGRRAVLMDLPGATLGADKLYARALEDGAVTFEQEPPGPPNTFGRALVLSPDGGSVAVHRVLHDHDELSVMTIRTHASEARILHSLASTAEEQLAGFGAGDGELVAGKGVLDIIARGDVLVRHDMVAGQTRTIAQSVGNQAIEVVKIVPETGRLFFELVDRDASTTVLFVDDPGDAEPRALTPLERTVDSFNIAEQGDRLAVALFAGGSVNSDVLVLDERNDWQAWTVPTIQSAAAEVTFFANPEREGMIMSVPGQLRTFRIASRDAPDAWDELSDDAISWQLSPDNTRALILARRDHEDRMLTLDLRAAHPQPEDHGSSLVGNATFLATTSDGNFVVLTYDGAKVPFDVRAGSRLRGLPADTGPVAFDRLGRYLAYSLENNGSCDVFVLGLDPAAASTTLLSRSCPATGLFWVD